MKGFLQFKKTKHLKGLNNSSRYTLNTLVIKNSISHFCPPCFALSDCELLFLSSFSTSVKTWKTGRRTDRTTARKHTAISTGLQDNPFFRQLARISCKTGRKTNTALFQWGFYTRAYCSHYFRWWQFSAGLPGWPWCRAQTQTYKTAHHRNPTYKKYFTPYYCLTNAKKEFMNRGI